MTDLIKGDLVSFRLPGAPWEQWKKTGLGHVLCVGTGSFTVLCTNTAEHGAPPKRGKKSKRQCPFDVGKTYTVPHNDCRSVYTLPEQWRGNARQRSDGKHREA